MHVQCPQRYEGKARSVKTRNRNNSFNDGNAGLFQVAGALSALESVAGAVRVNRFDHSTLSGFDSTDVNTDRYKMEYIVHFEGAARSGDLPLLTYGRNDDVNCGKHMRRR